MTITDESFFLLASAVLRQAYEDYSSCMRDHYKAEVMLERNEMKNILGFVREKLGVETARLFRRRAELDFRRGEKLLNASYSVLPGRDSKHPAHFICPFCGKKAIVFFSRRNSKRNHLCLYVDCRKCGISEYRTWKEGSIPLLPEGEGS